MTIVGLPNVSDTELEQLGRLNPGWAFERDDEGQVLMSPMLPDGSAREAEALVQLAEWVRRTNAGGRTFSPSAGFKMSTGAVRSPDASWLSQRRLDALTPMQRESFWRVCPDVVVEIRSQSDTWEAVVTKVQMYRREGANYAVAIDPIGRNVMELGNPLPGLAFDFDAIMDA
jgi:Uma2 family endonuclease